MRLTTPARGSRPRLLASQLVSYAAAFHHMKIVDYLARVESSHATMLVREMNLGNL